MAKVITYSNILNPLERKTKEIEANTAYELLETMDIDREVYEVIVSKNQEIIEGDFEIKEGDIITVSIVPQGGGSSKSILGTVAMIALVAVAPYAAGAMMGATAGMVSAGLYGGLTGSLIFGGLQAAIIVGGGMLVNSLLMPQTPSFNASTLDNLQSSPTYSWDVIGNSIEQGKPVPILYGTHRVTPPLVSKFVETKDNLQYINLLYAVADGVTTIDGNSVYINDETIRNYNDVEVYTRDGSNEQNIIGIFDDVISDKQINRKLSTEWVYTNTDGNTVSGIEVGLVASQGIWYVADDGKLVDNTVKVQIEYYRNGQWIAMATDNIESGEIILGYWLKRNSDSYLKFSTKQDALDYQIGNYKPQPIETSSILPDNAYPTDWYRIYVESETIISEVKYAEITNNEQTALRKTFKVQGLPEDSYQVRARFYEEPQTGSRYGSTMYFEYLQETITDDFTYPNTALLGLRILATDQLSGSLPRVSVIASNSLNNPSDVCKDILERSGENLSSAELTKFTEWKNNCIDRGYTCNIYFDSVYTVRKALDIVGLLGRGSVIQFGSKWSVIIDKPDETPVQGFLFTMGNITKDSFNEQFLPLQDRANKIEITYYDDTADYAPQILEVSNATYDTVDTVITSSINYVGCTNKDMALRYAKYLLNCNRYLTITQSFEVDTEAMICRVGDVIKVAHDLPQIGYSGRIVSATTSEIVLDREVLMEAGESYYIEIRYSDTDQIVTANVVNSETETDTIEISPALTKAPTKHDIYSFGTTNRTSKKMRVLNITKGAKQRSKITAIEYIEDIYNDSEQIEAFSESTFGLKGLSLTETISYTNTSVVSTITASWRGESLYYNVYVNNVFYATTYNNTIDIAGKEAPETYTVKIVDSRGAEVNGKITLIGRFAPPEPPTNFKAIQNGNIVRFNWTKSIALDVEKYEIRAGVTWESSFKIGLVGNVNTFEWFPDMNRTYRFWIKSLDYSNIYSVNAQEVQLNITGIDEKLNVVITEDFASTTTPPCGTTSGLVFIVGKGYIPISTATFEELSTLAFNDISSEAFGAEPTFESCAIDTQKIGLTKIRILSDYTATSSNATFGTFAERTFGLNSFDTFGAVTVEVDFNIYFSISDDDITYSDYELYTGIVDRTFRYIKIKYEFNKEVAGLDVLIQSLKLILDVPDINYTIKDIDIVNNATISYNTYGLSFYQAPNIRVTSKDAISFYQVTNITNTSFDIYAYDSAGSPTTARFDINIQGY